MHSHVPIPISLANSPSKYIIYRYFRTGTKKRQLLEGLTRARLSTATQCLEAKKNQFSFGFCKYKKYTFQRGKQPQVLAIQNASHVSNQSQPQSVQTPKYRILVVDYNIFTIISQQNLSIEFLLAFMQANYWHHFVYLLLTVFHFDIIVKLK